MTTAEGSNDPQAIANLFEKKQLEKCNQPKLAVFFRMVLAKAR
jgi:hypothetical protein